MKENVFKTNDSSSMEFLNDSELTENRKGCGDVIRKDAKDYGVKTCIESEEVEEELPEEDPICFQEYLGMLKEIITAVEGGESLDEVRITYCKTNWKRLNELVKEFENAHLPVRADKLKDVGSAEEEKAKSHSKGTIVLENMMIKKQFTVLDILKKILSYYD